MRKLLLAATTLAMAGGLAATAGAQTAPMPVTADGRAPSYTAGATGSGIYTASPGPANDPGTVQAYLRGYFLAEGVVGSSSLNGYHGYKQQDYGMGEYFRIYPSMEGIAANGLKYGAFAEVRQQQVTGPGPSGLTGNNSLIWRRAVGWVGGNWGTVRFGQADGAFSLFATGTWADSLPDWSWNGDFPSYFPSAASPIYPFNDGVSGNYGDSKVVYLSPQIAGFDAGLSFEPTATTSGDFGCSALTTACNLIQSAPLAAYISDLLRNRDETEIIVRYRGALGPVGLVATAGYTYSGNVHSNANGGAIGLNGKSAKFNDVNVYDFGVQATIGGLALGGHLTGGDANPNGSRQTEPVQAGGHQELAWTAGASYTVGSLMAQVDYLRLTEQGAIEAAYAPVAGVGKFGLYGEDGIQVALGWGYSNGALLSVDYMYGQRHQANYDFGAGARGPNNNNTQVQGVILTNQFWW
jgi:hypothetical protein